jgi:nitrogenase iron protein NifH
LIFNAKNFEGEEALVQKTADEINTSILFHLPRDPHIQQAEEQGKTVVEAFPDSAMAKNYQKLARLLLEGRDKDE